MDPALWLAFAAATSVMLAIPGPTVMLVASYAMSRGRESGWLTVPGVALGDLTAMIVSLAGAGAVLAASAELFTILKFAGAAYLVWLGIQLWRSKPELALAPAGGGRRQKTRMFANAYVVTALNPKGIVFFVAFVPQFIDPSRPLFLQFVILVTTFVILGAINAAFWAIMAGTMRSRFSSPFALRLVNRLGGSAMIGAGLLTALTRRAAG
ncbi:LysE family translocator [Nisaea acidiphila]|uniref:LysE family translocator n=1 Tax=Nisaea acidiphila TaxID=1862145 RepID=A0A9J7ANE5_9PROT|nr:LysE family translocator [Nisaea acidiphila]UUX49163.1 LysE family translocator [Nisaea acidiphila]